MNAYTPVKLGTGKKVHAGKSVVTGSRMIAGRQVDYTRWDFICGCVNTHDINKRIRAYPLSSDTPITCAKCLALLETLQETP